MQSHSRFASRPPADTPNPKRAKPFAALNKITISGMVYEHQKGPDKNKPTGNGGVKVVCHKKHNNELKKATNGVDLNNEMRFNHELGAHLLKVQSVQHADKVLAAIRSWAQVRDAR